MPKCFKYLYLILIIEHIEYHSGQNKSLLPFLKQNILKIFKNVTTQNLVLQVIAFHGQIHWPEFVFN